MYHSSENREYPKKMLFYDREKDDKLWDSTVSCFPPAGDDLFAEPATTLWNHPSNPAVTRHLAMPNLRPLEQLQTQLLYIWRWMNQASVSKGNLGGIAIAHRLSPVARWDLWFKYVQIVRWFTAGIYGCSNLQNSSDLHPPNHDKYICY